MSENMDESAGERVGYTNWIAAAFRFSNSAGDKWMRYVVMRYHLASSYPVPVAEYLDLDCKVVNTAGNAWHESADAAYSLAATANNLAWKVPQSEKAGK